MCCLSFLSHHCSKELEIVKMIPVLLLATRSIRLVRLSQPLVQSRLNKLTQIVSQIALVLLRVIECGPIEPIPHERVQIAVESFCDQLDLAALHGHHQGCDTCGCHAIYIDVVEGG